MAGDYIPPNVPLYLTPDSIPVGRFCRTFSIPDDPDWVGLVDGAVSALGDPKAWREFGALTAEQSASAWRDMLAESWEIAGCPVDDLSPFWDDPDAADADGTPAESTYSYSLTAQVEDWVIAAFVAASGVPGAAATYLTIAPRFRLAFKTRNFGGIAQIFIDNVLTAEVDTYSAVAGQIFQDIIIP